MQMDITVIICTFNRSALLAVALESILASQLPSQIRWEILIADNRSSDETREVVNDFEMRFPGRIRYLFEPRPGKSYALNSAIAAATGNVLAFADDDITVTSQWLDALTAPILRGPWTGCGGRVFAQWVSAVPKWLDTTSWIAAGPLVQFDLGPDACALRETPMGTNMAFRKSLFEHYGAFRTDFGPRPGSEIRNEDSEFVRRLLHGGEPLFYEPAAIVYHPVPANRLTKKYFLAWWFGKGSSGIREAGFPSNVRWKIGGVPLSFLRRVLRWSVQWMFTWNAKARFVCSVCLWKLAGEIKELRESSISPSLADGPAAAILPE